MIGALLTGDYDKKLDILFRKKLDIINNIQIGLSAVKYDILVYATDYPTSIKGLVKTLSICDYVIYSPSNTIGAIDAEIALAIEFSEVKNGVLLVSDQTDMSLIDKSFKSLKISTFKRVRAEDLGSLRFDFSGEKRNVGKYASIDKHFLVKGIGSVLIGFVMKGEISKNDKMHLLPSGKQVTVKSIQVMDEDVKTAKRGEHVGLALNNATEDDLADNYGLSDSKEVYDKISGDIEVCKFYSRGIENIDLTSAFYSEELSLKITKEDSKNVCTFNEKIPVMESLLLMDSSLGKGKNRVVGRLYNLKAIS